MSTSTILPINDLIELTSIRQNTTYTLDPNATDRIIGVVDGATYGPDDDNRNGFIQELNNTDRDGGFLTIGGVSYRITLAVPQNARNPVTIDQPGSGPDITLRGQALTSEVAFITATPVDGGPARYFAVVDDRVGDFDVQSLTTTRLDFRPSGNDVRIRVSADNSIMVPCFASGTMIETERGARRIEDIAVGDLVMTRDNGLQAVVWMGSRHLNSTDLSAQPGLQPIRIKAGSLGAGLPNHDLIVSPQHRVLIRSKIAQSMFGTTEVLVAAKQLVLLDGIDIADDLGEVTYHHMLFLQHEIVVSNGAETESLYTGPEALKSVGPAARAEITTLFPELMDADFVPAAARHLSSNRHARKLATRHVQNRRPLVS